MKKLKSKGCAVIKNKCKSCVKIILGFMIISVFVFLTAGCGGGGGSSSRTGVFEDALVSGLGYSTVPGGLSGTTNARGEFNYKKDDVVTFFIGDIILGSAVAKAVMSPLDLVSGATGIEDPAVVNIARFLQSLDVNSSGGIIELPDGLTNVVNSWVIMQSGVQFGFDPDVHDFDSMTNDLFDYLAAQMAVYSSGMELVASEDAIDHMTDTLLGGYDGSYFGTYSGDDSGKWCFQINGGELSGTAWDKYDEAYDLFGAVEPAGGMVAGSADDLTVFTGSIDEAGNISGTWLYSNPFDPPNGNGQFSGKSGTCPYGDDSAAEKDNDGDGYTTAQGDCDDTNLNVFPGAVEICGNGVDEDCNGSDLSCNPGDIEGAEDIGIILDAMTQALGEGGDASEAAEMIQSVIIEMGLEQALDEGYTVLQLLTALNGYEGACGNIQREGNTLVYTITGAEGDVCIFRSGTVTLSGIDIQGSEINAALDFDNVQSAECSLEGTANAKIYENGTGQLAIEIGFADMTTCSGDVDGTIEAVYSSATDTLVSASAEFTASYTVETTDVDVNADLVYSPAGGIDGIVIFEMDGKTYHCTFNNVIITDCDGVLVATSGTLLVSSEQLDSSVTFDFSDTTCANPNVKTTVDGVLVNFTFD